MVDTVFQKNSFQNRPEANILELRKLNAFQIYDGQPKTSPHHVGKRKDFIGRRAGKLVA